MVIYKYHSKFSVYDIIPKEMKNFYKNLFKRLIFGLIVDIQRNDELMYNVPIYLEKLILKYIALFSF